MSGVLSGAYVSCCSLLKNQDIVSMIEREKHSRCGQAGKPSPYADHLYWPGDITELQLPNCRHAK